MESRKRLLALGLAVLMLFSCLPVSALPASAAELNTAQAEVTGVISPDTATVPDNSTLCDAYLQNLFYGGAGAAPIGILARDELTTQGQHLYDFLKENIQKVAAGESSSASFTVDYDQIVAWGSTAKYAVTDANSALAAFCEEFEINTVVDALLHDCPYELYWFDKVSGLSYGASMASTSTYYRIKTATFRFKVVQDHQPADYDASAPTVDTSFALTAAAAAENAQKLVIQYQDSSDYGKLLSYKNEICQLVSYNSAAVSGSFSTDADPWQLVYVFDQDASTNVVCEGYSKAFQYLCDLTSFSGAVNCYSVTGDLVTASSSEGHMWNIVTIDGQNYLVDVTNSDTGTSGSDGSLFLAGGNGSIEGGYVIGTVGFSYDYDMLTLWGTGDSSILKLAETSYDPCPNGHIVVTDAAVSPTCTATGLTEGSHCSACSNVLTAQEIIPALGHSFADGVCQNCDLIGGSCGTNMTWTLEDGTLTISGTGAMKNYLDSSSTPWWDYHGTIQKVVAEEGVTSIGNYGFSWLTGASSIELPQTLTRIGSYAFSTCTELEEIEIPAAVTKIGEWAFGNCWSLKKLEIPDGVTVIESDLCWSCSKLEEVILPDSIITISSSAFSSCENLKSLRLSDNLVTIAGSAFHGCSSLETIAIPASVTSIGSSAFTGCLGLKAIRVEEENETYASDEYGVLFNKDQTTLIYVPGGFEGAYEIPDTVTTLSEYSFSSCGDLTDVVIPASVTSWTSTVFEYCVNLQTMTFLGDAMPFSEFEFREMEFTAYYPETNATWTEDVLLDYGGAITWVPYSPCTLNGHTEVADTGFDPTCTAEGLTEGSHCSVCGEVLQAQEIIPATGHAWMDAPCGGLICEVCGETDGEAWDHTYDSDTDPDCNICGALRDIVIPEETTIPTEPEETVPETTVPEVTEPEETIPETTAPEVTEPEETEPEETIPETTEPDNTISGTCGENLTWVLADGVLTISGSGAMENYSDSSSAPWYPYREQIHTLEIQEGVTTVGYFAFCDYPNLVTATLAQSVIRIESNAFRYCTALKNLELPPNLEQIHSWAFMDCVSLESITIPAMVWENSYECFSGCSGLKTIRFEGNFVEGHQIFNGVTANAYYPQCNKTWTEEARAIHNTGADLTWIPYGKEHTLETIPGKDATCTEAGLTSGEQCKDCGMVTLKQEVIDATGHIEEIIPGKDATCTEGSLSEGKRCKICGEITVKQEAGSNNGHKEEIIPGKEATCTEPGQTDGKICSVCGTILEEPQVLEAKGHTYDDALDESCNRCGEIREVEVPTEPTEPEATEPTDPPEETEPEETVPETTEPEVTEPEETEPEEIKPDAPVIQGSNVASSGKPRLTWEKVDGAVKYQIYRSTSKNGTYTLMYIQKGTTYTNTKAVAGTRYYYKVKVVDANGNESEFSNRVSRLCDLARPNVSVTNVASSGKIKLTWKPIEGAVKYQIYRSTTGKDGSFKRIYTTSKTTFTNTSTKAGVKYYYKVRAVHSNTNANSAFSVVDSRMCDLARPTITVKRNASGTPRISWKKVEGAVKYEVWRATSKNGKYYRQITTKNTYLVNKSAVAGRTYYYKVRAIHSNTNANSAYSTIKYIKAK